MFNGQANTFKTILERAYESNRPDWDTVQLAFKLSDFAYYTEYLPEFRPVESPAGFEIVAELRLSPYSFSVTPDPKKISPELTYEYAVVVFQNEAGNTWVAIRGTDNNWNIALDD